MTYYFWLGKDAEFYEVLRDFGIDIEDFEDLL